MTRILGRGLLLSAVAVALLHGKANTQEPSSLGRIPDFQKKLNETIDYKLPDSTTTLDEQLDALLARDGIPYSVDERAFASAGLDKLTIYKAVIEPPMKRMFGATRATVLKKLLARVSTGDDKSALTYVLCGDHVEITTEEARRSRSLGDRSALEALKPSFPPLAYGVFDRTPLQDALKELARDTGSTVVVDARASSKANTKVTGELAGVPLDVAVQLLADMAGLKLVRVGNAYYVTTPRNADSLQKDEDRRRQVQENGDAPPAAAPGKGASLSVPNSAEAVAERPAVERKADDAAAQTLLRPLVALTAAAPAPEPPVNGEGTPAYRAMRMHKEMAQRIDYELLVRASADKVLNDLLSRNGIPWTVNYHALAKAGLPENYMERASIDQVDKMINVTRAMVLPILLAKTESESGKTELAYVIRPHGVEITTRKAFLEEFYPDRDETRLPPLAYAVFDGAPLQEALVELADATESNIVLDVRVGESAKAGVTANLTAVPLDEAVQVLADEAGLKLVRLGNVYYVTSPKHARLLRKEEQERRLEGAKGGKAHSAKPPGNP